MRINVFALMTLAILAVPSISSAQPARVSSLSIRPSPFAPLATLTFDITVTKASPSPTVAYVDIYRTTRDETNFLRRLQTTLPASETARRFEGTWQVPAGGHLNHFIFIGYLAPDVDYPGIRTLVKWYDLKGDKMFHYRLEKALNTPPSKQ